LASAALKKRVLELGTLFLITELLLETYKANEGQSPSKSTILIVKDINVSMECERSMPIISDNSHSLQRSNSHSFQTSTETSNQSHHSQISNYSESSFGETLDMFHGDEYFDLYAVALPQILQNKFPIVLVCDCRPVQVNDRT
jgi:hypothetical protein